MGKNNKNLYKTKHLEPFSRLFLVLVIVMVISIPLIYAFNFDNIKSYDEENKEVTIKNAFGLGKDIAKITLVENTESCLYECSALLKIESFDKDYKDIINHLRFEDVNGYGTSIEDYKFEWVDESKKKLKDYSKEDKKLGVHYLKITGYKELTQTVDWIPTLYGIEIDKKSFEPLMRTTNCPIDMAGNVWAINNWKPSIDDNQVIEDANPGGDGICIFIGLAGKIKNY